MTQGPAFPQIVPSGRSYNAGDYPVKAYRAQDGAEVRILYGSQRVGMSLNLQYNNIADSQAEEFIDHFEACKGTFEQFELSAGGGAAAKGGWEGTPSAIGAVGSNRWRYQSEPQVTSVYPGRSTVSIRLIATPI